MKLGIISGTGKEGKALAIRFGMYGHSIFIGSRSLDKAVIIEKEIKLQLPKIDIKGRSLNNLKKIFKNKKFKVHLSLSDDKPWAVASVIIFVYNKND